MIVQRVVICRIAVDAPHIRGSDFRLESLLPDVLLGDLNDRRRKRPRCGLRQIDGQLGGLVMAANLPDESRRMIARGLSRGVDINVHLLNQARGQEGFHEKKRRLGDQTASDLLCVRLARLDRLVHPLPSRACTALKPLPYRVSWSSCEFIPEIPTAQTAPVGKKERARGKSPKRAPSLPAP